MEARTTEITETFGPDEYREEYPDVCILFATDKDGRLHFPLGTGEIEPRPGWRVTALAPAQNENGRATG
jgi:hypothetical protein